MLKEVARNNIALFCQSIARGYLVRKRRQDTAAPNSINAVEQPASNSANECLSSLEEVECNAIDDLPEEDGMQFSPANDDTFEEEKEESLAAKDFEAEETVQTVSVFVSLYSTLLVASLLLVTSL